jgi:hypothetical protein
VVACTPQEWTKGLLTIQCDGTRITYQLKNAEQAGTASISEKLRDLIDELYVRMAQHGDKWTEATISFLQEGKELKYDTSFVYEKPRAIGIPATSKPRWKFW